MKIYILNDNREGRKCCSSEHGLSLYIVTDYGNLLFDAGQTDVFFEKCA